MNESESLEYLDDGTVVLKWIPIPGPLPENGRTVWLGVRRVGTVKGKPFRYCALIEGFYDRIQESWFESVWDGGSRDIEDTVVAWMERDFQPRVPVKFNEG